MFLMLRPISFIKNFDFSILFKVLVRFCCDFYVVFSYGRPVDVMMRSKDDLQFLQITL